jgi:hypothetical protein
MVRQIAIIANVKLLVFFELDDVSVAHRAVGLVSDFV